MAGGLFYVITLSETLVLTSEIIAAAVALLHSASLARAIGVAFPVLTRSVIVFWGELIDLLLSSSLNGINANEILWEKCKKRAGIEMSFHGAAKSNSSVPVWNYDS